MASLKAITNVFLMCIFSVLQSRRRSPTLTRDFAFAIYIRHLRSLRLTHVSKVGEHFFYMAFACCMSSRVE